MKTNLMVNSTNIYPKGFYFEQLGKEEAKVLLFHYLRDFFYFAK